MPEKETTQGLLQRIHRIHRQLSVLAARRKETERQVFLRQKKRGVAQDALKKVKEDQKALYLVAKEKEAAFNQSEAGLKKRRGQLFEAKNNKELQSLKDQIEVDQKTNDRLAEEVLELMGKADDFSAEVTKASAAIEAAEKEIVAAQATMDAEIPIITTDVDRLSGELTEAIRAIPRDFRGPYDRVEKSFGGENGLAPVVEHSFCGHCRQQIPIRYVAQICEDIPFTCLSCGRLLYLPEGFVLK